MVDLGDADGAEAPTSHAMNLHAICTSAQNRLAGLSGAIKNIGEKLKGQ